LYIALFFLPCAAAAQEDPDLIYRNRAVLADAQRAAAVWEQQVSAAPRAFESWWKRARAM
jgi:hypothetical protein